MTVWHNQRMRDDLSPIFSFSDRLRLGDGVFDTMLVSDGELIHPEEHFARLLDDALVMGMVVDKSVEDLTAAARKLIRDNYQTTKGRFALNTLISRGPGERGLMPPELPDIQVAMRLVPVAKNDNPIQAIISRTVRRNEGSALSRIKSVNYGDNILALLEARKKGANDAILLNNAGHVACATSGNIFIAYKSRLFTPPLSDGILAGITRARVLEKYDAIEKTLFEEDVLNAEGVFITNSTRGFAPITKLEGRDLKSFDAGISRDFHLS